MLRVLFVEDNEDLAFAVTEALAILGDYDISTATNGKEGLDLYHKINPHIVISDIEMPKMDGFELAQSIRQIDKECIIFLATGLSSTKDIMHGFEIGIDEYVKKPYAAPELHARLQRIQSRLEESITTKNNEKPELVTIGNFQFDEDKKSLFYGNERIKLTSKEFGIFKMLHDHKNELLTKEMLTEALWGKSDFFNARSLDVFINKLRKYIAKDSSIEIVTVRGEGLKLVEK